MSEYLKGTLGSLAAFLLWGFLPLYLKQLDALEAGEVLAHRIVWSTVFLFGLLAVLRDLRWAGRLLRSPRQVSMSLLSATLLSANWLTYIWAVNAGFIVDASLGYFINPLISVVLGYLFLGERLRPLQRIAVLLAATGVGYLTVAQGKAPWIALVLGVSFGFYGLLRKRSPLNSLHGLTLETLLLLPPALLWLAWLWREGRAVFPDTDLPTIGWIAGTGIVTALPLLLFGYGARKIPLATLGLLQYTAPSIQLLLGVYLYGETFGHVRATAFGLIWCALLLYTVESLRGRRRIRQPRAAHGQADPGQ